MYSAMNELAMFSVLSQNMVRNIPAVTYYLNVTQIAFGKTFCIDESN